MYTYNPLGISPNPLQIKPQLYRYNPKTIVVPQSPSIALIQNQVLSYGTVATTSRNAFSFEAVNSYVEFGSTSLVDDLNSTIIISFLSYSKPTDPSVIATYMASNGTKRRVIALYTSTPSNSISFQQVITSAYYSGFDLSNISNRIGNKINFVFRSNGTTTNNESSGWANGIKTPSLNIGGTGTAAAAANRIGMGSNTAYGWTGNIYIFAAFDSKLPDDLCREISEDPFAALFVNRYDNIYRGYNHPKLSYPRMHSLTGTQGIPAIDYSF